MAKHGSHRISLGTEKQCSPQPIGRIPRIWAGGGETAWQGAERESISRNLNVN